ncbi:uncharacterized protein [Prorops nasuta]|uniref:uncharacterized protein n=1 Tax=Prorops nasuta TaxID=863751 RepID=UPI0034CD3942
MAPVPTRKLIAQQRERANNISRILPAFKTIQRNRITRAMIRDRKEKLRSYWSDFCKCHEDIIVRDDVSGDTYVTESFYAQVETIRDECHDELEQALTEMPDDGSIVSNNASVSGDQSQAPCHNLNLPKIDLPQFSGRCEDWEAFENRFVSLIHDKPQLSNVVKLEYLLGCLRDSAAEFVKDVTVSDANYTSTWNALKDRFSNLRLQVYNLTLSLLKSPPLKKESAAKLRSLLDNLNHSVRMLRNLGRPVDSWDDILVVILSERLDSTTRKSWETYLSTRGMHSEGSEFEHASSRKKPPSFKEMTEFLEGSIQALHSVELESNMGKPDTHGKPSVFNNQRSLVRAHYSGAKNKGNFSQSSSFNTNAMKCPFCSAEHYVGRCEKFRSLNSIERHKEIKRLGLCFNCLGRHQVRNCSSKRSCKKCQGSHHSMLHHERQPNFQTQQDAGLQNPGPTNQENQENPL